MPHYNPTTNLLEEEYYHYELQDVDEPQLYRDVFPYHDVPRIVFNHRQVPMNPPEQIYISDTTFRDGQQSRPPFTPQQIATIYDMLHRLSGPKGSSAPASSSSHRARPRALRLCQGGLRVPRGHQLDPGIPQGFQLVRELGIRNGDAHLLLRLPHLPQAQHEALRGHGQLPRGSQDGPGRGHRPPLPSRGYHPGRLLRFRDPLRARTEEAVGRSEDAHQGARLRHPGLRRHLPRRGAAPQRPRDHLRTALLGRRAGGLAGVARAQ